MNVIRLLKTELMFYGSEEAYSEMRLFSLAWMHIGKVAVDRVAIEINLLLR
jgi:hypothetical protein